MGLPEYADRAPAWAAGNCAHAPPDWRPSELAPPPAGANWRHDPRRHSSHSWGLQFWPHLPALPEYPPPTPEPASPAGAGCGPP
eukprot:2201292-Alexandrium_andersonii.AAC.1